MATKGEKIRTLKGELVFGKVSQGRCGIRIVNMKGLQGNANLCIDSSVLGEFDPITQAVEGSIEITVNVKKK